MTTKREDRDERIRKLEEILDRIYSEEGESEHFETILQEQERLIAEGLRERGIAR